MKVKFLALVLIAGLICACTASPPATETIAELPPTTAPTGPPTQAATSTAPPESTPTDTPTTAPPPTLPPTATPTQALPLLAGTQIPFLPVQIDADNFNRTRALARWGRGYVNQALFSPDGETIAAAYTSGIYFFDAHTLDEIGSIRAPSVVQSIAFGPQGVRFAVAYQDGTIDFWYGADKLDFADMGEPAWRISAHEQAISRIAISPDGESLASGGLDHLVKLWRAADGELLHELAGHTDLVSQVAFSPDGLGLASASYDGTVRVWTPQDGSLAREISIRRGQIRSMALSPDGATLATSSMDEDAIRLHQVADGKQIGILSCKGYIDAASLVFSTDGSLLIAGNADNVIRIWRLANGENFKNLTKHKGAVFSLAISPDGRRLLSGSEDESLNLMRFPDGDTIAVHEVGAKTAHGLVFTPDGEQLAYGWLDGNVRFLSVADGGHVRHISLTQKFHMRGFSFYLPATLSNLALSPDGEIVAMMGGFTNILELVNAKDGSPVTSLDHYVAATVENFFGSLLSTAAYGPHGEYVAAGSVKGDVLIWRVADGELVHHLREHEDLITDLAFSADGTSLASVSLDQTVKLWRVSDGELLLNLTDQETARTSVAISPDGESLVAGAENGAIRFYGLPGGELLQDLPAHEDAVASLAFSQDGKILASAGLDRQIVMRLAADPNQTHTLSDHVGAVSVIQFSPDMCYLASASWDGTIILWGILP